MRKEKGQNRRGCREQGIFLVLMGGRRWKWSLIWAKVSWDKSTVRFEGEGQWGEESQEEGTACASAQRWKDKLEWKQIQSCLERRMQGRWEKSTRPNGKLDLIPEAMQSIRGFEGKWRGQGMGWPTLHLRKMNGLKQMTAGRGPGERHRSCYHERWVGHGEVDPLEEH